MFLTKLRPVSLLSTTRNFSKLRPSNCLAVIPFSNLSTALASKTRRLTKMFSFQTPLHAIISSFFITAMYQGAFFGASVLLDTDKLTDVAGTTNIALLALLSLLDQKKLVSRQVIATGMVAAWAFRLAPFLLYRIQQMGHDWRLEQFRKNTLKWAGFWIMQGAWVFTQVLPVLMLNTHTVAKSSRYSSSAFGLYSLFWLAVFAAGWSCEALADMQKYEHRQKKNGRWISTGLWKYSRHPNYFGEILMWIAIYMYCRPGLGFARSLIALASPLFTFGALMFLSGIPLLEFKANKDYGQQPEYMEYKRSTSPLVPVSPEWYRNLEVKFKRMMLDIPLYWKHLPENAIDSSPSHSSPRVLSAGQNASPALIADAGGSEQE